MTQPACLLAGAGRQTNPNDSRPPPRLRASTRMLGKSRKTESKFLGGSRVKESSRLDGTGSAMGADESARSVGTVVAYFPTAATKKSVARGKKVTKRAWG